MHSPFSLQAVPSLSQQYNLQHSSTKTTTHDSKATSSSRFSDTFTDTFTDTKSLLDVGHESTSHHPVLKSHDTVEVKPSLPNLKPSLPDVKPKTKHDISLPSFDDISKIQPNDVFLPPRPSHTSSSHDEGNYDDSNSSDWSSSEEEGEDMALEMKPSSHNKLVAEWEWRAMKRDGPDISSPTTTTPR